MKSGFFWLGLMASPLLAPAQPTNAVVHQRTITPGQSTAETAVLIAGTLLGKPYVHHTLENNATEHLVVNLNQFDCTTFIETTLALALAGQELPANYTDTQFDIAFRRHLTRIRYRNGQIDGYASRLHYLSDWLRDNERKGVLQDVTREVGGVPVQKLVNYMTAAAWKYPRLADPAVFRQIAQVQTAISQQPFYFIPKKLFKTLEHKFREGDIVMLTAARPGLDMRHVGYATWRGGKLHLLHASSDHRRVVLTQQPLAQYLLANKRLSGVRVARLRTPPSRMATLPGQPLISASR